MAGKGKAPGIAKYANPDDRNRYVDRPWTQAQLACRSIEEGRETWPISRFRLPSGYEQAPDYGGRPPVDPRRTAWIVVWALAMVAFIWWVKFS